MASVLTSEERYMKAAIAQAKKAMKMNETPIGCVIVHEERIIARGYNRRNTEGNVLSHAEINAIKKACRYMGDWRLEGCVMYVTLEPCPMCAGALIQSRIDRVVIGAMNPKAGFAGSLIDLFSLTGLNHKVEIKTGVLKDECSALLTGFFKKLRSNT